MKIVSIVGARPQFIKLAPISEKIKKIHDEVIIHTGQHFDSEMSDNFFNELGISDPHFNLNINSGLHGEQTGRMIIEIEKVIIRENPSLIIVFGDTNSTIAGALVGSKLQIPIVHIESGLRSFNKKMPEEVNRVVTDHISDYLFAPTPSAVKNLEDENLSKKCYFTGDIMVDSLKLAIEKTESCKILEKLKLEKKDYYLLTLHRPYNVDNPKKLAKILIELGKLSKQVVFPVHPRTRIIIEKNDLILPKNIFLSIPLGYLDFVMLQLNSFKIITDSGGIQKEAYILKKPCITLRSETEWVETVQAGWNLLLDPNEDNSIADHIEAFYPSNTYEHIFGTDVSNNMISLINKIM